MKADEGMTDAHRKYVQTETMVSIVLSIILSLVFAWLVFPPEGPIPLGGPKGIGFDLVPTTFMIVFMTTVALTLLTRSRRRKGAIDRLDLAAANATPTVRAVRKLPRHFVLRGFLTALGASIVFIPLMLGILIVAGVSEMTFVPFLAFKGVYGAFLAALFTPIVLVAALSSDLPMKRAGAASPLNG